MFLKYGQWGFSMLWGVLVFLFWWLWFPQALSFQEQYQLFLFSSDYLSELLVQFHYIGWLGAMVLAVLSVLLQRLVWRLMAHQGAGECSGAYLLSFVPSVLSIWMMGDESVLLSYTVALLLVLLAALAAVRWWKGKRAWWTLVVALACQVLAYFLLPQWPVKMIAFGLNYYRTPEFYNHLQWVLPLVIMFLAASTSWWNRLHKNKMALTLQALLLLALAYLAVSLGYDADKYEVIRQDWLVRQEKWSEVIDRASRHQVKDAFSCNCVNLALAMERRLADSMFDFYQSGEDALLMPMQRDMTSNIPTAEAFWRLGMVNSARRYMADLQESILNARKSGRFTKRIVECLLVNGQYALADKHLALLRQSLFYRSWAREASALLYHDDRVAAHPVYGKLRQMRYKDDFLYSYPEIDKMLGLLFVNNQRNTVALDYFMGQLLLKGDVPSFMQYMSWVQQYGGYQFMPRGYQDAVKCIQSHGEAAGSAYGAYVKKKMGGN